MELPQWARAVMNAWLISALLLAALLPAAESHPTLHVNERASEPLPGVPYFLGGAPSKEQKHAYSKKQARATHTAAGPGLLRAQTGQSAVFTVYLADADGESISADGDWNLEYGRFIYAWIASEDQMFHAEVVNNGNGTLTATYRSDFPGEYLIYVEDVDVGDRDEGKPIVGSPFAVTISGDPTLDVRALPLCLELRQEDIGSSFWKPGTWLSTKFASPARAVGRDGWIFQPRSCSYEAFSYNDLMMLAALEKPTWMLVIGSSIQRGFFMTMVDMVLAQGQKDNLDSCSIQKCWGYADVTVGNLRLTFQDSRIARSDYHEDSITCNDRKISVKGSTGKYIKSAREFLRSTVFPEGGPWPTAILAPLHLVDKDDAPNYEVELLLQEAPKTWDGKLLMLEHMGGFGSTWTQKNPTMNSLEDISLMYRHNERTEDDGLARRENWRKRDSRVSFLSMFPMYQAKLFENETTFKTGMRSYAANQHLHHFSHLSDPETFGGAKMVQSTMTEMIAHIFFGEVAHSRAKLHARAMETPDIRARDDGVRESFKVCHDCMSHLMPFEMKPKPQPKCKTVKSFAGNQGTGTVVDFVDCPDWCLSTEVVDQTPTGSGNVKLRVCPVKDAP